MYVGGTTHRGGLNTICDGNTVEGNGTAFVYIMLEHMSNKTVISNNVLTNATIYLFGNLDPYAINDVQIYGNQIVKSYSAGYDPIQLTWLKYSKRISIHDNCIQLLYDEGYTINLDNAGTDSLWVFDNLVYDPYSNGCHRDGGSNTHGYLGPEWGMGKEDNR